MIIKEAPQAANIFGAYSEGPVFIGVECQSGLTFQYEADLVSLKFIFRSVFTLQKHLYLWIHFCPRTLSK